MGILRLPVLFRHLRPVVEELSHQLEVSVDDQEDSDCDDRLVVEVFWVDDYDDPQGKSNNSFRRGDDYSEDPSLLAQNNLADPAIGEEEQEGPQEVVG